MSIDVSVIMGSDSDLPVMSDACRTLEKLDVAFEVAIISAHRTPLRMVDFAEAAARRRVKVIIAGAGGAAHLPGMVASLTDLPVIGVPVRASHLEGLDSMHSIVQMPRGVPVATVAINNARNAALLAARILALADERLAERVTTYRLSAGEEVVEKSTRLEEQGWRRYLEEHGRG